MHQEVVMSFKTSIGCCRCGTCPHPSRMTAPDIPEVTRDCGVSSDGGRLRLLLRIVTSTLDSCRQLQIDYLARIEGMQSVKAEIPMQRIKASYELPLPKWFSVANDLLQIRVSHRVSFESLQKDSESDTCNFSRDFHK